MLHLVLTRLRRLWALQLALWLGLIAAVGFAGASALIQATGADFEFQTFLTGLGPSGDVIVSERDKEDQSLGSIPQPIVGERDLAAVTDEHYRAFQGVVADRAHGVGGGLLTVSGKWASSSEHAFTTLNGRPYAQRGAPAAVLAAHEGIDSHMTVVATQQPPAGDTAVPIAVTETSAAAIGAKLGDVLCISDLQPQLCVRVVTLWRPISPSDPFLTRQLVADGDMFVPIDLFYQTLAAYPLETITAWARLNVDLVAARRYPAAEALQHVNGFGVAMSVISGSITEQSDLAVQLGGFVVRSSSAQFGTQLMAIQVLGLALLYVAFAAGHVLNQQRQNIAVWRVRGWSSKRVFAALIMESALMAFIALPVGLAIAFILATFVSGAVYHSTLPELRLTDLAVPTGIALAVILALLTLQVLRASNQGLLDVRRQLSRPEPRPWWQWRYLDLGLALLSVPILIQLHAVAGSSLSATDPLATSIPILVLILLSVAALRLLPLLARLADRLGRGLASSMAASQFARQPAHVGAALLLSVSTALGIFAVAYGATEQRNAADRTAYRVGSDILVSTVDRRPAFSDLSSQLQGLQAQSFAYRYTGDLGTQGGPIFDLLAVDPYSMKNVAWSRSDLNPAPLPDLLHKLDLEDRTGILLGGHPKTLTLLVYTSGVLGLNLAANVTDANGQPCDCQFGALGGPGWTQVSAPLSFARPVAYPLRFGGLSFQGAAESEGTVAISDLRVDGTELESFSKSTGWSATDPHGGSLNLPLLGSELVPRQGLSTVTITLARGDGDFILRPPPPNAAIPALASTATMSAFNLIENAPFTAYINGYAVEMIIVGVANNFPTLYQGQGPWIVADLEPLLVGLAQTSPYAVWPNQAWYNVDPAVDSHDLEVARHSFPDANILDRRGLDAAAASDPVRLGLESNLFIGAITALTLGITAFALYFLVVARGRLKEYAVLEGGGMPRALIWRSLFVEQLIVLGFSLGTGVVLGLVLAFVLLPELQLGIELFDIVPATVVTIDARLVLAVLGSVALAALLFSRLGTRVGGHYRLMDELRSL